MATNNAGNICVTVTGNQMLKPEQYGFSAFLGSNKSNVTGDGTLYQIQGWGSVLYDIGSCFNATSGVFTVPVTGLYHIVARICASTSTSCNEGKGLLVASGRIYEIGLYPNRGRCYTFYGPNSWLENAFDAALMLNVGDTVYLVQQSSGGTKSVNVIQYTHFSINLLS